MKSKDIIDKLNNNLYFETIPNSHRSVAIREIDRLVEQKSIEFAEWIYDNGWSKKRFTHPNKVGQYWSDQFGYKPISELYQIFKQEQQKTGNNG